MSERAHEPEAGLRCLVADNPGPMTLDGTRVYQVGSGPSVLLDPGPAAAAHRERLEAWLEEGPAVEAVCLTHAHPDHAGAAEAVARDLDVPLTASSRTLDRLGATGREVGEGDELELGGGSLLAIETPGHAPDHLAWLWLPTRAVFTGDLVLGAGSALVGHPEGHVASYLASLRRLMAVVPSRLYPGHGEPVDDAVERLREYAEHRRERGEQIRRAVSEGARSVSEIRRRVYGELPQGLDGAAEASIRAHLEHLEEEGVRLPSLRGRKAAGQGHH